MFVVQKPMRVPYQGSTPRSRLVLSMGTLKNYAQDLKVFEGYGQSQNSYRRRGRVEYNFCLFHAHILRTKIGKAKGCSVW